MTFANCSSNGLSSNALIINPPTAFFNCFSSSIYLPTHSLRHFFAISNNHFSAIIFFHNSMHRSTVSSMVRSIWYFGSQIKSMMSCTVDGSCFSILYLMLFNLMFPSIFLVLIHWGL